ncbi:MAG: type II toxin-antitoxin system RelE/ParE family toxin [Ectothiorhodospiraceae bacterium]|nr:type II toxin-antitoxin system RelE/ParE family toxin [Ectothiorhodospiraceae bacterium]MBN4053065.1 type II toxin-antitoxin system RelE/ParE family toxin [Gammaproteobacteria bacterium AH-315-K14]
MKILISDSAYTDLEAIKEYYTEEGVPHIGEQFIVSIIEHIETLPANPDIGRKVPEFNTDKIRELIHGPFRVVYLREEQSIHVVRIWRSERLLKLENTPAENET